MTLFETVPGTQAPIYIYFSNDAGTKLELVTPSNPLPVISVPAADLYKVTAATAATAGTAYVPADTITIAGGSYSSPALLTVTDTKVITATVVAGGTGGTPGAVTITGTTGTGTKFQATGTITAGGVLAGALTVTVAGDYTVNPTDITAEPVTGGSLTGTTVLLTMGVLTVSVTSAGAYDVVPTNPASQLSTSGSGTGATFNLTTSQSISNSVTIADGGSVTLGAKADAKSTATDTTPVTIMQVLKEISFMEQTPASRAVTNAGTFAVQLADGAAVTIGTEADAAWVSGNATLVQLLKAISGGGTNTNPAQTYSSNTYSNITTQATTVVKSGAGTLASIIINKTVASGVITIYDNTAGSGTTIATITNPAVLLQEGPIAAAYDIAFATGLTIVTSGATQDITVSYR